MYVVLARRAWYFAASRVGTEAGDHQGAEPERCRSHAKDAKDAKTLAMSGRIGVREKCDRVGGKRVFWKPCAMGG